MKKNRVLWLIIGLILFFAGVWIMGSSAVLGIVLFLAGITVMMLLSISIAKSGGSVKANYFHHGGSASQKLDLRTETEAPADIWDQITEGKGETE